MPRLDPLDDSVYDQSQHDVLAAKQMENLEIRRRCCGHISTTEFPENTEKYVPQITGRPEAKVAKGGTGNGASCAEEGLTKFVWLDGIAKLSGQLMTYEPPDSSDSPQIYLGPREARVWHLVGVVEHEATDIDEIEQVDAELSDWEQI